MSLIAFWLIRAINESPRSVEENASSNIQALIDFIPFRKLCSVQEDVTSAFGEPGTKRMRKS
jgi:hypothetical protein